MYHIPENIKQDLENIPFLLDFKYKLHKVFKSYDREINYEDMGYIEGSVG